MKNLNDLLTQEEELSLVTKVSKKEKEDLINCSDNKTVIKYLVDQYTQSQDYRITAQNQVRSLLQGFDESDIEQLSFIQTSLNNALAQEALNKKYMDITTDNVPVCRWMKSICGIGPVHAAHLYAAFDVKTGRYNTDFLSYAGLNDNNNPWLGTEKAKKLVAEAIEYRDGKFKEISDILKERCGEKIFKKLSSELKKLGKTSFEFDISKSVILNAAGINIEDVQDLDYAIISDYIKWLANPKRCDDILIDYVASKTRRKFINVKKGTERNWINKKTKGSFPTIEDLTSYLAKPPYNTDLKTRMYLIGVSFIKVCNNEKSLYGRIYKEKRIEYARKNDNGEYAERAEKILSEKNFDKSTVAYKALITGKLPESHIISMARRYAVKLFISHVFEAMYYDEYNEEPPKTYVIEHLGHHDYIAPEVDYRPYIDGEI